MRTRIRIVGGFLGAGKTTLLAGAAEALRAGGSKVALITNDQAAGLVDTALLSRSGVPVSELSGSCFCCNFNGFMDAVQRVGAAGSLDAIIAEPVGSCTDLSATILQPLKAYYRNTLEVAPLSVLADPVRLTGILDGGDAGLDPDAAYILRKQLDEADLILLGKADALSPGELADLERRTRATWPDSEVLSLSPKTGSGVREWLDRTAVLASGGRRIAVVDYDRYARGEAVLGWLNAVYTVEGPGEDLKNFPGRLMEGLRKRFRREGAAVGHVKALFEAPGSYAVANLTATTAAAEFRGALEGADHVVVTLNARVQMAPADLETAAKEAMEEACPPGALWRIGTSRCLRPGRPEPTYRFTQVAG